MRIISFDPASTIGWSVIDDNGIIDFGRITCSSKFSLPQKLNFFHLEIVRLVDRYDPDYMAVEDVIMGISGPKVLILLSRINGVVIQAGFHKLKDKVRVYKPTEWKSESVNNINGNASKWKIQLEACRHFSVDLNGEYDRYDQWEKDKILEIDKLWNSTTETKKEIDKLKTSLKRKRNPLNEKQLIETKNKIAQLTDRHQQMKSDLKNLKKSVEKELSQIGTDIEAQSGISSDIADSMCIAVCLQRKLKQ
jgi:Holliday junction resolvasome RuvABC endonuclease subunit